MYCIKADSEDNPWNIWNQNGLSVFDSNLIFWFSVRRLQATAATLNFFNRARCARQQKFVVGQEELESSTFAVSERHSNQLNY